MPRWYIGFVIALAVLSLFASLGAAIIKPLLAIAAWFVWLFVRNLVRGARIQTNTGVTVTGDVSVRGAAQRAKFCSECGTPHAPTGTYCHVCGTRIQQ